MTAITKEAEGAEAAARECALARLGRGAYVRPNDLAAAVGLRGQTIRSLIAEGRIVAGRLRRDYRIPRAEAERFIREFFAAGAA